MKAAQKKYLVRAFKDFKKIYKIKISHISGKIDQNMMEAFFALHIRRWSKDGIKSKFNNPTQKQIYLGLSQLNIDNIGKPIIFILESDGNSVAMCFGYHLKERFLYQISAFNPDFIRNSPAQFYSNQFWIIWLKRRLIFLILGMAKKNINSGL